MEQKHVLLSALSVGVGLGVGLGLSTGQAVQKWVGGSCESDEISGDQIVLELNNRVIDGKNSEVTFDKFPYYLSERIRFVLTSTGYVYLKQDFSKHLRNLHPASRAILLSGPAEPYQQNLARALAHYFKSKLLLLDITDFLLEMQRKYGCPRKEPFMFSAPLKCTSGFCFDEKLFVQSLYKVLVSISETSSVILYIKDVEKLFVRSTRLHNLFQKLIKKLSGSVLILGSQIIDSEDDCTEIDEKLSMLFPYNIEIKPPQEDAHLASWRTKLIKDKEKSLFQDSRNHIAEVLAANDVDCDDLEKVNHADTMLLSNCIEEIVASAISHHLMETKHPEYRNRKLVISHKSLSHVLNIFQESESNLENKDSNKEDALATKKDGDNEFEKRMRAEVVPANEIGVTFEDIGALDDIKELLEDVVMLPLRRPDLFKGGLLKPYKGILLFGPPGTGKTMLAKAIANEAGASFINVSISNITSKWFGEDEKNVRALFSLAAKVAPTIIFIDEVDSMLGKRTKYGEHEAMRKIKNEFMAHWDGILTKPGERILVLAATNRPFDLDEAIIRRFERRIMVGLPSAENREMILKTLLAKEKYEHIDFNELSTITEGYTGSDLKNLCTAAAYRPVREVLQQERLKEKEKKKTEAEVQRSEDASDAKGDKEDGVITSRCLNIQEKKKTEAEVQSSENASDAKGDKDHQVITLRPLNMEDMRLAKSQIPNCVQRAKLYSEGSFSSIPQKFAIHRLPRHPLRLPSPPRTQSAVSAVHFLLQSVEAALPKQKKNVAVTEFKHAMVAHKRRCKAHQVEKGSLPLPQDILVLIFSFLDMKSLVSVGLVCRSWNIAANDNHLWEMQYVALFGGRAKLVEGKNNRLLLEPIDTRIITDWKEAVKGAYTGALSRILTTSRGYCGHCKSVVWLNNSKCPNVHSGISEIQDIKPVTAFQAVEYVLEDSLSVTSSSDSDSDSEGGTVSRLWAYPKHIRK
ncbi:hypothetical protein JHK86_029085 [Glycine max]|nr:hypothetical protein JHK86_029085 [Glycine max]